MKIRPKIYSLARLGRGLLLPIHTVRQHLPDLVRKTGKELHFQPSVIQQLAVETEKTLTEMGIRS